MSQPDEFTVVGYLPIDIDPEQADECYVIESGRIVAVTAP